MIMIRAAFGVALLMALAAGGLYFYADLVPAPKRQMEHEIELDL